VAIPLRFLTAPSLWLRTGFGMTLCITRGREGAGLESPAYRSNTPIDGVFQPRRRWRYKNVSPIVCEKGAKDAAEE